MKSWFLSGLICCSFFLGLEIFTKAESVVLNAKLSGVMVDVALLEI
jgi:hypothetical protein